MNADQPEMMPEAAHAIQQLQNEGRRLDAGIARLERENLMNVLALMLDWYNAPAGDPRKERAANLARGILAQAQERKP